MAYYSRRPTRIPKYDYSSCNYYFITICTHNRKCIFGSADQLNQLGRIAQKHILRIPSYYESVHIDKFVVMPNHIHIILILNDRDKNPDVSLIVGQYKRGVTKEIRELFPDRLVWQRSFHDHVIRNQTSYEKIWMYIENNPKCWKKDCFYMDASIGSAQINGV